MRLMTAATVFDPFGTAYLADPYEVLRTLRQEQPIFYDEELDYWVLTRYADVDAVFRDPDTFSAVLVQDPIFALSPKAVAILSEGFRPLKTLSNLDGPEHVRTRRATMVGFSPGRLRGMEPLIRHTAADHLEAMAAAGTPADFIAALAYPLPAAIIFALLGFPPEDTEMLKGWCGNRMAFSWGRPTEAEQLEIARDMVDYYRYCEGHIENRLKDPGDDFTSDLLAIYHDDPEAISVAEITHIVYGLSFAGHETTTNLLANTLRRVLETDGTYASIASDRSLIPGAVDEGLRHDSSVISWRRVATKPTVIGEVELPEGARLLLSLAGANHDPESFARPEQFDLHRDNANRHLSFGFGKHYCLGATLAKLEISTVLDELVGSFPDLGLVTDQEFSFDPNVSFRGPAQLLVEW